MYCSNCGKQCGEGERFCGVCGSPLGSNRGGGSPGSNKKRNGWKAAFWITIPALAVIAAVCVFIFVTTSSNTEELENSQENESVSTFFDRLKDEAVDTPELGNSQTYGNAFAFCCQRGDEPAYFCFPDLSKEIMSYEDGTVRVAYQSMYPVVSIFETDDALVLETRDNFIWHITLIDKETGNEEILLSSYEELQVINIFNVYDNIIYYYVAGVDDNSSFVSVLNYKTFSYDIGTGQTTYLFNGGCSVTTQGIYYCTLDDTAVNLWRLAFKDIGRDTGTLITSVKAPDDTDNTWFTFFGTIFDVNDYCYFAKAAGADWQLFRMKQNTAEYLAEGYNLHYFDGSLYLSHGGALYKRSASGDEDFALLNEDITNVDNDGWLLVDICVFKDAAGSGRTVIASMETYSETVRFWDEYGNNLCDYRLEDD